MTTYLHTIVLLGVVLFRAVDGGAGQTEYYDLVNNILGTYNKNVRPTTAGEGTVVTMNLRLKSLVQLDEKNQILETYATLVISWNDDYLTWNTSQEGNISRILYPQTELWLPDVVNENSVESQVQLGYNQLKCAISNDGTVLWQPSEIFKTTCDIDVTYYPFDTQECSIIFSTMMSTQEEIDIDPYAVNGQVDLSDYSESSTWKLMETTIETPTVNDEFTRIIFKMKIKRLRFYYVTNILLPVLLLSTTTSMVFYLPADSGEKIGMSITVLLSFTVYLTIIAEKMPETSTTVSLLGVYILILLSMSCLAVILSVLVLNINHRDPDVPIPLKTEQWTRAWRRNTGLGVDPHPTIRPNKVEPTRKQEARDDLRLRRLQTSDTLDDSLAADFGRHNNYKDKIKSNQGSYEVGDTASDVEEIT